MKWCAIVYNAGAWADGSRAWSYFMAHSGAARERDTTGVENRAPGAGIPSSRSSCAGLFMLARSTGKVEGRYWLEMADVHLVK